MRKHIRITIPKRLNPQKLLKRYPLKTERSSNNPKYQADKLAWILNAVATGGNDRSEHMILQTGFKPLNAKALQKIINGYQEPIQYLHETGTIEIDHRYEPGVKSRGYRLLDTSLLGSMRSYQITDPTIINKYFKYIQPEAAIRKYPNLFRWVNDSKLQVDGDKAFGYLSNQRRTAKRKKENNQLYKIAQQQSDITNFENQQRYFKIGKNSNRLFTSFGGLKKQFRKWVTYDGKEIVYVDMRNAQPYLLQVLYSEKPVIAIREVFDEESIKLFVKAKRLIPKAELQQYRDLVNSGSFYEFLGKSYEKSNGTKLDYENLKKQVLTVFYADNFRCRKMPLSKIFIEHFPNIYKTIEALRTKEHSKFAHYMQQVEAYIILDNCCKELSLDYPEIPIFTIHDNIATTKGNEEIIQKVMKSQFEKFIEIAPTLKIE